MTKLKEKTDIRFYYKHRKLFFNKLIPRFLRFGKTVIEKKVGNGWEEIYHCHNIESSIGFKTVVNMINNPHVYVLVENCVAFKIDEYNDTFYIY